MRLQGVLKSFKDPKKMGDVFNGTERQKKTSFQFLMINIKEIFNQLEQQIDELDIHDKIFFYIYYMTENGWPLREGYFSEFELKRLTLFKGDLLKNLRSKNYKTDKIIIGGLIIVRMLILELIFQKQFEDEPNKEYSPHALRNYMVLGSFLYIIFSHYIKEHIGKCNEITEEMKVFLANKSEFQA